MSSFLCFPDFVFGFQHSAVICQGIDLSVISWLLFVWESHQTTRLPVLPVCSSSRPRRTRQIPTVPRPSLLSELQLEVFS